MIRYLLLVICCFTVFTATAQEIREYMDLQIHPTMHMAHPIIGDGLLYFEEGNEPDLSYKHTLTNVNYANYLQDNKGMRIIVHGAIVPEVFSNKKKARKKILDELKYVNDFAAEYSDKFVVAYTPEEVRKYVHTTDKTIIIHSVEGAEFLINSQADADFWAEQGVAFMTLIHLVDNKFGGAATLPTMPTRVINFRGSFRSIFRKKGNTKGLTEKGKQAILWMANAGMLIDMSHMSPQTRTDVLALMAEHDIPPLSTHDGFKPIQNHQRGIPANEVVQIYKGNGLMSLGTSLESHKPQPKYQEKLDSVADSYCNGSIDSYQFTYTELNRYIEEHLGEIFNDTTIKSFDDLTEAQKVQVSVGFQTDFNGWTNHARPRVGEDGCFETEADKSYHTMETEGMPHPGLMPDHWDYLEKQGVDLDPILRSSEKFLQMWQYMLDKKGQFDQ